MNHSFIHTHPFQFRDENGSLRLPARTSELMFARSPRRWPYRSSSGEMVTVSPVRTSSERLTFIRFPWKIYADYPAWVPPIVAMQKRELNPETGSFFTDGFGSKAEFFLARRDGEVVGRIAAIRNERHLRRHDDAVGFFGFFESIDDPAVAEALLEAAENWLTGQNLIVSRGPTSFTLNDPAGVTIRGADLRPSVQIAYTPPYYADLLEATGYRKIRDLLSYHVSVRDLEANLFRYEEAFVRSASDQLEIRPIRKDRLEEEAIIFARVFSAAWDGNWGAFPMLPEDLIRAARAMGPFFDERLCQVALAGDKPIGVFLAAPDPAEIFHRLDGRMGLRGRLKIMKGRRDIRRFRLFIFGVLPGHDSAPIGPLMLRRIQEHLSDFPAMETVEFSWILEDNRPTRQLAESIGGKRVQTLRIYDKFL